MAIALNNEPRECGELKDGWYLESEMMPGGRLLPWVWVLGEMTLDHPNNLMWKVKPQSLHQIDGEQSLDTVSYVELILGMASRRAGTYKGSRQAQLEQLLHGAGSPLCLLKHTGRESYTPALKAIEVSKRGASERLGQATVTALAPLLRLAPIKLFYSTPVPFLHDVNARNRVLADVLAEEPNPEQIAIQDLWGFDAYLADADYHPTYDDPTWRWSIEKRGEKVNNGSNHWWVKYLSYWHRVMQGKTPSYHAEEHPAVFGGTHLTIARRVVSYEAAQQATGHDTIDPVELDDLQFVTPQAFNAGVQVAVIPPKGETHWNE